MQKVYCYFPMDFHILDQYSKMFMDSCVIFLATSYYCTIFQEVHVFLCHILGNLILLHHIPKGVLIVFLCHILGLVLLHSKRCIILVSYSWQPHIIAPYSKVCLLYSCVIFLVTSYYCTIFQEVHVFLCHILGNLILLHCIPKGVLIVFLCHILGNLILLQLLHCIPRGACILVSYSWQPHIIAPYSERCAYCILVSYSW